MASHPPSELKIIRMNLKKCDNHYSSTITYDKYSENDMNIHITFTSKMSKMRSIEVSLGAHISF